MATGRAAAAAGTLPWVALPHGLPSYNEGLQRGHVSPEPGDEHSIALTLRNRLSYLMAGALVTA